MFFRKKSEEVKSGPTYSFEILPDNVPDGEHEFDSIKVNFWKPGWQWVIYEHNQQRWTKVYSIGEGYLTRDAALVDLLKAAKVLNGDQPGDEGHDG